MYEYDGELIKKCLDLDEWKYSWHIQSNDYREIKRIILEKIHQRIEDLILLIKGLIMVKNAIAYKKECERDEFDDLLDEIKVLYHAYGLEDDAHLTKDAQQLKQRVLELVDEIKRLYNLKLK